MATSLVPYVQGSAGRGSALAPAKTVVKKQAAPTKAGATTVATTKPPPPPPAAPNYATLMAQAATQASKLAAQQIQQQVDAITAQQAADRAQATQQAAEINKAALAAAQFLGGLGDRTKADYAAAVDQLGGLAGGFTGGLRDTAQAAADQAQAQLASIPGNEQQITSRAPELANLLYGVSGYIPANALEVQGLGATAAARALPAQQLSYGQQQAYGVIGEGNKTAAALNAEIAKIRATLPSTTSTYLTQFEKSAQDQITNARNATNDYYSRLNTLSQIDARTAAALNAKAAAKRAGRALTLKEEAAQPHFDMGQSRDGIMRDQYGTAMTSAPDKKGVRHYLLLPGWKWQNGAPTPPAKPETQYEKDQLAAQWTRINHYKSRSDGYPVPDTTGHIQPTVGYQPTPDGQSVMPIPKPAKPFIPKIDKTLSAGSHALAYFGEDGQPHLVYDANKNAIPYDPATASAKALQVKNSGGYMVVFDPNTGKFTGAFDDAGNPLTYGAPKAGPVAHYGSRFIDATTGHWMTINSLTGEAVDTGKVAPQKAAASLGTWQTIVDKKTGAVYRINNKTNEIQPIVGFHGLKPPTATAAGGPLGVGKNGPGSSSWRLTQNRVDSQLQQWTKAAQTNYTYDFAKNPPWQIKPGGAVPVKVANPAGGPDIIVPASTVPKTYTEALQWAIDQGGPNPTKVWVKQATNLVNDAYPLGLYGHFLTGADAANFIAAATKEAIKRGWSAQRTINRMTVPDESGKVYVGDEAQIRAIVDREYTKSAADYYGKHKPPHKLPGPALGTTPTVPRGGLAVGGPPSAYAIP